MDDDFLRANIVGVVIDPGHGGTDLGAVNGSDMEKNFNLEVSRYMKDRFEELGVPVKMIREDDETLTQEERVQRIKDAFGDRAGVIVISNHLESSKIEGADVLYALRNSGNLSSAILSNIASAGQVVRNYYQRRLAGDSSKDYYYVQRLTSAVEPVVIHYGSINNASDLNRIRNNLLKYGEAVVKAVATYGGIRYVPPTGTEDNFHIVKAGDSLYKIANEYGVSVDDIIKANNLTSNILTIGQILLIPKTTTPPEPSPPTEGTTYTVKSGDSLYSIAQRFGTTAAAIQAANNLQSTTLSIGQQLIIPGTGGVTPPPTEGTTYTVKSGDSLYSIAQRFGTTVAAIQTANNLQSTTLSVGQQLIIPGTGGVTPPPTEGTTYTVKSGDSLYSIAQRFGTTTTAIQTANNLKSTTLSIGQQLIIPGTGGVTPPPTGETTYTVKSGDSLYSIAQRFGTTTAAIQTANNLKSTTLSIGQQLIIPTGSGTGTPTPSRTYTVQKGDSLYSIGQKYNTTADAIKSLNNLTSNALSIGQVLKIPS